MRKRKKRMRRKRKKEDEGKDKADEGEDKAAEGENKALPMEEEGEDEAKEVTPEGEDKALPLEEEGEETDKQEGVEKEEKSVEETEEESHEVLILRRFDRGFEKWLCQLTEAELEKVVSRLMKGHDNEQCTKKYMELVQSMEHEVRYCSKCRRSGCEKCDYIKCLRHVVRHQKPGDWFMRSSHDAVSGTVRFLNANRERAVVQGA